MTSLSEMTRVFGRIGLLSFGGPAAQIALMHKELVEDRPWRTQVGETWGRVVLQSIDLFLPSFTPHTC